MTSKPIRNRKSTLGLEDPEDQPWHAELMRKLAMATLNEPLSLQKALDRLGFMFDGLIDTRSIDLLRETVLSSDCPYSSDVVQEIENTLKGNERVSDMARHYAASAWVNFVLATEAKTRGDESAAWYHLSNAQYQAGRFDGDYSAMRNTLQKKAAGQAGGEKKSRIRDHLMRRCIEQLIKRRPPEAGWRSHEKAFTTIAPDLLTFSNDTLDEPLTEVELKKKMMKWLTREDFQRAYAGEAQQP